MDPVVYVMLGVSVLMGVAVATAVVLLHRSSKKPEDRS
jgi:hypothetical protein